MKLIWGGQHMAGMKYFMQNTYTVLTLVNANFRCNRYDFASSKTINNIYMYWGNEVIFKCIIGHQMTNWFLPFVLMLKKIFKCAKLHWLCCCNLKCSMYFCCTCFSMGDLGVQVSVRLFVHLSVRPSVRLSVRPSVNIYHGCLVSATPLTVFYWSFWNFADAFFMVWGCAWVWI